MTRWLFTFAALVLAQATAAAGGTGTKLVDPEGLPSDGFGRSVAASGDVLVAGRGGSGLGSVIVYRWSGSAWEEEQEVVSAGAVSGDEFGASAALDGDWLFVGSPGRAVDGNNGEGVVTVFRWSGASWEETQELTASSGAASDRLGSALAADNDVVVAGAVGTGAKGAALVYRWNGSSWVEEALLSPGPAENVIQFGRSVAASGDRIVVGATVGLLAGGALDNTATVYQWNGASWDIEQVLASDPPLAVDGLGWSVALNSEVLVVGAPNKAPNGVATVYRWSGTSWLEETELAYDSPGPGNAFGSSVALHGDVLLVGSWLHDLGNIFAPNRSGAAVSYRWNGTTWVEEQFLAAADAADEDQFGKFVAVSGEVLLVGAPADDIGANGNQGSIHVHGEPGPIVAQDLDVDQGETATFEPGGDGGDETEDAVAVVTNTSGGDDATITVTEGEDLGTQAGGFGVFGVSLTVETSMADGEYFMTLSLPFTAADLGGANPLLVDLAYFDTVSGEWELSVSANTQNSPGHASPVGDRSAVQDVSVPTPAVPSAELGDYGVFWNTATERGYAWANLDHTTEYKLGLRGMVPVGCGVNPDASLAPAAGLPVLGGTFTLALDDPFGSSPDGSLAFLLAALSPDPAFPCGTPLPGYGMNGPLGELLVNVLPPDPVAVLGPATWSFGAPAEISIPVPNDPVLLDVDLFLQGVLASATTIRFTDGLQATLGN